MKLDLACGQNVREGYTGVDISAPGTIHHDLLAPWPWADNSIDALHCSHFIEHIPMHWDYWTAKRRWTKEKDPLCWFFDEAWRVIRPNGLFDLEWPALQSVRAFQDPTHRRFIPLETMSYWSRSWRQNAHLDHYNIDCNWVIVNSGYVVPENVKPELVQTSWNVAVNCYATLRAIK